MPFPWAVSWGALYPTQKPIWEKTSNVLPDEQSNGPSTQRKKSRDKSEIPMIMGQGEVRHSQNKIGRNLLGLSQHPSCVNPYRTWHTVVCFTLILNFNPFTLGPSLHRFLESFPWIHSLDPFFETFPWVLSLNPLLESFILILNFNPLLQSLTSILFLQLSSFRGIVSFL